MSESITYLNEVNKLLKTHSPMKRDEKLRAPAQPGGGD